MPTTIYYKNQLRELLTNYGEITEVWWDGACGEGPNGKKQIYDWDGYIEDGPRVAAQRGRRPSWGPTFVGSATKMGLARESEWSVLPSAGRRRQLCRLCQPDLGNRKYLAGAKKLVWYPAECDVSIRPGWFYHANEDGQVKSLKHLLDIYYRSVGRNAVLLLNVPPDRRGLFHENDVARLREFRAALDETFKTNLVMGKPTKASSARRRPCGRNGRRRRRRNLLDACRRRDPGIARNRPWPARHV